MTLIVFDVSVSVKITHFPHFARHYVLPSTTLSEEMFQYLRIKIRHEFQLEPENYNISLFETLEQPPCEVVENMSIRNQFQLKANQNRSILLYIIRKNREIRQEQEQESIECPICYVENSQSNRILTNLYYCGHPICQQCHIQCINHNQRHCSLCRRAEIHHI